MKNVRETVFTTEDNGLVAYRYDKETGALLFGGTIGANDELDAVKNFDNEEFRAWSDKKVQEGVDEAECFAEEILVARHGDWI